MDITELRKLTQSSRESDVRREIWFSPLFRFFSVYITNLLIKTKITPNQISFISVIIGIIGGICFSFGSGLPSICGSLFLFLAFLFDHVDGEVARYKKMCSLTGLTFDMFSQCVIFIAALIGISIGSLKESGSLFLIVGFMVAILYLLSVLLSTSTLRVAALAKLHNENHKSNIEERTINESIGKKNFLGRWKAIGSEFLKIPNQKLLFLLFSILDTTKAPKLIMLSTKVSYLMTYVSLLFLVILVGFIFKIIMIAKKRETDRIFGEL